MHTTSPLAAAASSPSSPAFPTGGAQSSRNYPLEDYATSCVAPPLLRVIARQQLEREATLPPVSQEEEVQEKAVSKEDSEEMGFFEATGSCIQTAAPFVIVALVTVLCTLFYQSVFSSYRSPHPGLPKSSYCVPGYVADCDINEAGCKLHLQGGLKQGDVALLSPGFKEGGAREWWTCIPQSSLETLHGVSVWAAVGRCAREAAKVPAFWLTITTICFLYAFTGPPRVDLKEVPTEVADEVRSKEEEGEKQGEKEGENEGEKESEKEGEK